MSTKQPKNTAQKPAAAQGSPNEGPQGAATPPLNEGPQGAATPPPQTDNSAKEGQARGALSVRTRRGVKTRRRAGMRFYQEVTTLSAADLSRAQIRALRADPDLVVEDTGHKGA